MKILQCSKFVVLLSLMLCPLIFINGQEKWKVFSNARFSFKYSPNFSLQIRKNKIRLFHFVNFKHNDPCDQSDAPPTLNKLIDFDSIFEINRETQKFSEPNFTTEDWEKLPFGSIDTGKLKGEGSKLSVEGCGVFDYSFAVKSAETLLVKRQIIGMFSPPAAYAEDAKEAASVKGVINAEKEETIFKAVIESIRIK